MIRSLADNWGWMALRGALLITFGALAFIWPIEALFTLVLLFGILAILDGFAAFTLASRGRKMDPGARSWPFVLLGVVGLLAGIAAFVWPGLTAMALLVVIAVWAILRGILEIVVAVELRREIRGEWFLVLAGLAGILFGLLLLWRPGAGALALVWMIGAFAIVMGAATLALALRLRRHRGTVATTPAV